MGTIATLLETGYTQISADLYYIIVHYTHEHEFFGMNGPAADIFSIRTAREREWIEVDLPFVGAGRSCRTLVLSGRML